jgi:hypothetical protein
MHDQLDWQRACLIGNYFMSAISAVQSSLNAPTTMSITADS